METGYHHRRRTCRRVVGTAVNPHGGWKHSPLGRPVRNPLELGRPLILMGDGNTLPAFERPSCLSVGTAVNPHGGWKPGYPNLCVGVYRCWDGR